MAYVTPEIVQILPLPITPAWQKEPEFPENVDPTYEDEENEEEED